MRIGIIALLHESNTFAARPTTIEHFRANTLLEGEAVRDALADAHHETGGFFQGLADSGPNVTAVPVFAGRALPSGTIAADAFDSILKQMFAAMDRVGTLDGILVAPHGATVSEEYPDADGHWLTLLRERVGPTTPIVGTLDAHANLSPQMVEATDALVAYRTNPHLDQRERGREAASLLVRTLRGEVRPTMRAAFPPMAINIERQLTTDPHLVPLYQLADQQLENARVLSNSILLGFPYSDVAEMGSAALVVADNDADLAEELTTELADHMWRHRSEFVGCLIGVDEAIDRCASLDGPICLLDMGDNVGGGSAADGTELAHALQARSANNAFVCLYDPEAVLDAVKAGVGSAIKLTMGGKTDTLHGSPVTASVIVQSLHEGTFSETQPRHGGITDFDQGRTAVVQTQQGLTVMLTSRRMVPFSLEQLRSCNLDPSAFRVLVAKGVNAPVAAYQEVCRHFVRVNTNGSTCADMTQLEFRHRRRPMFPFEAETTYSGSGRSV